MHRWSLVTKCFAPVPLSELVLETAVLQPSEEQLAPMAVVGSYLVVSNVCRLWMSTFVVHAIRKITKNFSAV